MGPATMRRTQSRSGGPLCRRSLWVLLSVLLLCLLLVLTTTTRAQTTDSSSGSVGADADTSTAVDTGSGVTSDVFSSSGASDGGDTAVSSTTSAEDASSTGAETPPGDASSDDAISSSSSGAADGGGTVEPTSQIAPNTPPDARTRNLTQASMQRTNDCSSRGSCDSRVMFPSRPGVPFYMSYLGNDATLDDGTVCGLTAAAPCLTIMASMSSIVNASGTGVMISATVYVEVTPDGSAYPCEQAPEGVYVGISVTIATYSKDATGVVTLHGDGASQTTLQRVAYHIAAYEAALASGGVFPTPSSDLPPFLERADANATTTTSTTSVTFDCAFQGRAFYAYTYIDSVQYVEATILRLVGINIINGDSSLTYYGSGGAVFGPDASFIAEDCTFSGHTGSDLVSIAAAVQLLSPLAIFSGCRFTSNTAAGGAGIAHGVQQWSQPPSVMPSGVSVWNWIDRCTFFNNTARDIGGAVLIDQDDYTLVEAVRLDITRSVFTDNAIVEGPLEYALTKLSAEGGALGINLKYVSSFQLLIDGCVFEGNTIAPLISDFAQDNSHMHGGAAYIRFTEAAISSSVFILNNLFEANVAGVGGAILLQPGTQHAFRTDVHANDFVGNVAHKFGHMSQGGAIAINPGPRIDTRDPLCALPSPTACPLLDLANSYTISGNRFDSNFAEGVGGAILIYYRDDYAYYDASSLPLLVSTGVFPFPSTSTALTSTLVPDTLTLASNTFTSNWVAPTLEDGQAGVGGSVALNLQPDVPIPLAYDYATEVGTFLTFVYSSFSSITDSTFYNSSADCSACYGGSLYLKHGLHTLSNVSFSTSYAGSFGGSVFLDVDSTSAALDSCSFVASRSGQRGQAVHSLSDGPLSFASSSLVFDTTSYSVTQLDSALGGQMTFTNQTRMACTPGFSLRNHSIYSYRASSGRGFLDQLVSSRAYSCEPCAPLSYSLDTGYSVDDVTDTSTTDVVCRACPFGGVCADGQDQIKAREGNWADRTAFAVASVATAVVNDERRSLAAATSTSTLSDTVSFYSCPSGYCCPIGQSCPLGYCAGRRTGILCSQCQEGYAMVLLSSTCRPVADCNDAGWFFTVAFIGSAIVSLLIFFSPKSAATITTHADERRRPPSFSSVSKVVVYFYQILSSILTPASKSSLRMVGMYLAAMANMQLSWDVDTGSSVVDPTYGAAQVQGAVSSTQDHLTQVGICISTSMTGVGKIAAGFLLPGLAAFWLAISYVIFRFVVGRHADWRIHDWMEHRAHRIVLNQKKAAISEAQSAMQLKLDGSLSANPLAATLGHETAAAATSEPLDVTSVDVSVKDHESFAQHDGNKAEAASSSDGPSSAGAVAAAAVESVSCKSHSHPISCVFSAAAVELFLLSYSALLRSTMSLLACVDIAGTSRLFLSADVKCYTGLQVFMLILLILLSAMPVCVFILPRITSCNYSLRVVESRYVIQYRWYESVLMLRRYIFVLMLTFILDPFIQSYFLLVTLILSLMIHQSTRPFCSQAVNHLETLCLFCLTCVAAINVRSATLASAQVDQAAETLDATDSLDALNVFFILTPLLICVICWAFYQLRLRHERRATEQRLWESMKERPAVELGETIPAPAAHVTAATDATDEDEHTQNTQL